MDVSFVTRSKFLLPCKAAVRSMRARLENGESVSVDLQPGGYGGRANITIRPNDPISFGTDYERSDVTWFPVRIRAAATALRDCGCTGRFNISHNDGRIAIRRA